jgi:hypothetical protein
MSMYSERLFKSLEEDAGLTNSLNNSVKSSSQKLLTRYCQKVLGTLVPSLVDFYTVRKQDSPTTVSPLWISIYKELLSIEWIVGNAFNEPIDKKSKPVRSGANAKKDRFTKDMDKIFAERMQYLPEMVHLGRKSTLSTLVKCILKAVVEIIRSEILNVTDYKQLQIDMCFVRIHFSRFDNGDGSDISIIIDECLHSGSTRCEDPKNMDTAVLEKLVSLVSV